MKTKKVLFILLFLSSLLQAQELKQVVRGVVIDKVSQMPMPGAVVNIAGSSPVLAAIADAEGKFSIANVPVGKRNIQVSMIGYKPVMMQNISVNSGKEVVLTIQMEEDATQMAEVEVLVKVDKNKPLNEMSTVSTRAFSVEETQKFAAAVNDPARMAQAFAGVVSTGDGNNNISIRGNSPNGLLWRMEGVEIPNPNHFANVGTSGGGISILSAQLLNNSDFSTGAFAAEYGNALSGVFDLRLRKGNNQKREYTIQAGFLGLDVAAEGPFKKGYDGSFLINYRYSTLSVLSKIGVPIGDAITNFQDLSYHIYLPTKHFGNFSAFGFGGLSDQTTRAKKDSLLWREDPFNSYNSRFHSNTGAMGFTHTKMFSNQSYLKTVLLFSGNDNGFWMDQLLKDYASYRREYVDQYVQTKSTLSSVYTIKISAASSLRAGLIYSQPGYQLRKSDRENSPSLLERLNVKGSTQTAQAFVQYNHRFNTHLSANAGLHYFQLFLNNSRSLEPRASVKYEYNNKNTWTLGYGLHSQLQPMGLYFSRQYQNETDYVLPNKNLGLSKAHHVVLGYDRVINRFSHIKTEVYYQHLFSIPVSADKSQTYSVLNAMDGYNTSPLVNQGLGKNYGLELTYERFLHKDLYYLLSAAVYDSKYRTSGGQWYNSRYNTNFAVTFTAGKDWTFTGHDKNRVLGLNIKSVNVGGMRYTPVDLQASAQAGDTRYVQTEAYTKQNPAYYRLDLRVSLKRNYTHLTTTLALDIQNVTNRKNVGGQYFDTKTATVKYWYQTPLLPVLSYRLEF